jgi:pimeloyl-ACP methyl ester carboxylesterase
MRTSVDDSRTELPPPSTPECKPRANGPRWRWRYLLVLPLMVLLGVAAIAATTAWRAVSVVRPPRVSLDSLDIDAELPGSEQVSFLGPDGVTLAGNFVPPRNGTVIVLVHGLFASRRQLLPEAQLLAEHGYGVLVFDNRAHGASGGAIATWGLRESGDVERAVDFVEQRAQVPAGKVGLLGFSIGGTAVIREAIGDARIGAVVVESTYSSMGGEIAYMFSRYGPFSKLPALWTAQAIGGLDYSELVAEDLVCQLKPRPLLLVYGVGDSDVPREQAERMAKAACSASSLLMLNADSHGGYLGSADATLYADRLLTFFGTALQPASPGG